MLCITQCIVCYTNKAQVASTELDLNFVLEGKHNYKMWKKTFLQYFDNNYNN